MHTWFMLVHMCTGTSTTQLYLVDIRDISNDQRASPKPGKHSTALEDAQQVGCNDGREGIEQCIQEPSHIQDSPDVHACCLQTR